MEPDLFETTPDFVNDGGVKWWLDKDSTRYAMLPDGFGTTVTVYVYFTEEKNLARSRVIVQDGKVIYASQSLEAIGTHIDFLKLEKRSGY